MGPLPATRRQTEWLWQRRVGAVWLTERPRFAFCGPGAIVRAGGGIFPSPLSIINFAGASAWANLWDLTVALDIRQIPGNV